MTSPEVRERNPVRSAVGILAAVYAGTFLVAVLLHLGVQIPLGFAVLDEPPEALRRDRGEPGRGGAGGGGLRRFRPEGLGVGRGDVGPRPRPGGGAVGDGPSPPAVGPTPSSTTRTTGSWWCSSERA